MLRWAFLLLLALTAPLPAQERRIEVVIEGNQQGLDAWVREFRGRALAAGLSPAAFQDGMAGVTFLPKVIERDRRQDEFTKAIWDYLDKAISEDRIALGRKALREQAAVLDRIEATYGVDREAVVAIWGLESSYGAVRGDVPTISALTTLAYDGRRGAFFEGELTEALRILQGGHVTPGAMLGSWAGAMGHTQFMPSSWARLAVDFDGDGKRNIWGDDPADALASTAAYLAKAGWKMGAPWGREVRLPKGFDYLLAGPRTQKPLGYWAGLGVTDATGGALTGDDWASLLLPAGAGGPAFLIFDNFAAIETYNLADSYVIAVGHLADRLAGGGPFAAPWPRDLRVLDYFERIELQERLTAAGFDTLGADAKMGPRTLAAIRGYQVKSGLIPDGYPSLPLLERLRSEAPVR
ncbi:lytic murein transglycosylase [Paracoccaceae bacterium]